MRQSVCHPVLALALWIEVAAFSLRQSVCSVWACFRCVSLQGCFSVKARTTCITNLSSLFCRRMWERPRVGASFEICRWDGSPKWPTLSALAWVYRFAFFFISLFELIFHAMCQPGTSCSESQVERGAITYNACIATLLHWTCFGPVEA